MVTLTKQKMKHPRNWADAPAFVPVSNITMKVTGLWIISFKFYLMDVEKFDSL